ncbi:MAG TPA: response regulator [Stenomitos sp.]
MIASVVKQILVIEAEPNMQQIVQACLTAMGGWQVLLAASGQEALQLAIAYRPDAILLEGMTLANLEQFLSQLRSHPQTQHIPLIFLTAQPQLTERRQYLSMGAVGAIAKPFDPLTLVSTIATLLNWSQN